MTDLNSSKHLDCTLTGPTRKLIPKIQNKRSRNRDSVDPLLFRVLYLESSHFVLPKDGEALCNSF